MLTIEQSLAGFGDPVIIFIATLFVVSEGLESTGVTAWAGQQLIDRAGASRTRLLVLMMLTVAFLTAFVTVNARRGRAAAGRGRDGDAARDQPLEAAHPAVLRSARGLPAGADRART